DPAAIGKTIDDDSVPTTIIGVMPHAFAYPNFGDSGYLLGPSIWQPIALFQARHTALNLRGLHVDSRALLRLRAGVDSVQAAAVMQTIARRLAAEYPIEQAHWTSVGLQSMTEELYGNLQHVLLFVSSAIALVLV